MKLGFLHNKATAGAVACKQARQMNRFEMKGKLGQFAAADILRHRKNDDLPATVGFC